MITACTWSRAATELLLPCVLCVQDFNLHELCYTHTPEATKDSPTPSIRKTYVSTTTSTLGCMNPCMTTPITPSTATTRLAVTLALLQQRRAPRLLVSRSHRLYFSYAVHRDYSSSRLHRLYCAYAVHLDALSRRSTSRQTVALALTMCPVIPLCVLTTRLVVAMDILRLRRASGCLGTSRGLSCGSSRRLSSTTSTTPRVRVPRYAARLVAPLIVDYFAYAARPGASARRATRHAARRRLLRVPRFRLAVTLALLQPHRASRLLALSCRAYSLGTHARKDEEGLLLEFPCNPTGLVLCNPTRTLAL
jgi:hypothetical protein